jgi:hypothetical protein
MVANDRIFTSVIQNFKIIITSLMENPMFKILKIVNRKKYINFKDEVNVF